MNIDTDTQWVFWSGVKGFKKENYEYFQGQIEIQMELINQTKNIMIQEFGYGLDKSH